MQPALYPPVRRRNRLYSDEYRWQLVRIQRYVCRNTPNEARVQGLSEVFERHIKNRIIAEASACRRSRRKSWRAIRRRGVDRKLEAEGFPIFAYDGSLGGKYRLSASCCLTRLTAPASLPLAPTRTSAWRWSVRSQELLQGRSLKDLDVFTPPTFDDEEVAEHANLETHFIDSSGLISWDMFKQDADYRSLTGVSPAPPKKSSPP